MELATRLRSLRAALAAAGLLVLAGCVIEPGGAPPEGQPQASAPPAQTVRISRDQAQRLTRLMEPLLAKMNNPISLDQAEMAVLADPSINAANAGNGRFMVTTGLLEKSNDSQLRAILAHEVAHEDLGHVAKTSALAAGVEFGKMLLDQIYPISGLVTPLAGQLIVNAYTRGEESEADAHAVKIMDRAGYDGKTLMAGALRWIQESEGGSSGGFFATHPATGDRIRAIAELP